MDFFYLIAITDRRATSTSCGIAYVEAGTTRKDAYNTLFERAVQDLESVAGPVQKERVGVLHFTLEPNRLPER